jgi:hypothetical protein
MAMSRCSSLFALVLTLFLTGCIGHRRDRAGAGEDQALQEDIDADVAACRCRFLVEEVLFDVPCGTTYCLGVAPVRCDLDGVVSQLPNECATADADQLIAAVCRQDYPGHYPVDCASIADPRECESYGGCAVELAPCTEASFGCEGFTSTP